MAFGLNTNPWILLGAATIVIISCVSPLATGQSITTSLDNSNLTTISPGVDTNSTNRSSRGPTGTTQSTTGGQPEIAGAVATVIQSQIIAAVTSCNETQNCTIGNKVEIGNTDLKDVCNKMDAFIQCIENKCTGFSKLEDILKDGKNKYQDCSGCALQVSTIIMLLAIVVSRLV